jgi:protein-S-isoprenylcysteine O-methyltransferase Ste14
MGFRREALRDLPARAAISLLFLLLSMNLLAEFLRTHHVTGLMMIVSEALVVVLTVFRRRAFIVDRSIAAAAVTLISTAGPPLLRAADVTPLMPDLATALISCAGLALVIAGKATLGRSFGLVPANRGVVVRGPYVMMRHPIYAGYLLCHIGFLAAHPGTLNAVIMVVADTALIIRALFEERVLGDDERYRAYCTRVGWHLVPGIF